MSETPRAVPWQGRPERADLVIIGAIVAYGVYGFALIPLVPALIGRHPLLLEWLAGSTVAEVTVGALSRVGQVPVWVAVLAGVPSSMFLDWAFWWAGRRWGDRSLHLLLGGAGGGSARARARAERRVRRVERTAARFGPVAVLLGYYLPVPNVLVYAAAGLAGMRLTTFLVLDTLGVLLWVGLLVGLGYGLGQHAVDVVHRIDHYSLLISLTLVAVVIVAQVARRRG